MKRTIVTAVVAVAICSAEAHPLPTDLAGAKWIGGNPVTLPDHDFGKARWIAPRSTGDALVKTVVLSGKPEVAELVVAAHGWFSVEINGLKRWGGAFRDLAPCGAFHDWRYAKFVDAVPALSNGDGTTTVVLDMVKKGLKVIVR